MVKTISIKHIKRLVDVYNQKHESGFLMIIGNSIYSQNYGPNYGPNVLKINIADCGDIVLSIINKKSGVVDEAFISLESFCAPYEGNKKPSLSLEGWYNCKKPTDDDYRRLIRIINQYKTIFFKGVNY